MVWVAKSNPAIAELLGAERFLDARGELPSGEGCWLYANLDTGGLDDNPRAAYLAARAGLHNRDIQKQLRGLVLVTGVQTRCDDDANVPTRIRRLLGEPA